MYLIDKNDGHIIAEFDFNRLRAEVLHPYPPTRPERRIRDLFPARAARFLDLDRSSKYISISFEDGLCASLFDHDECVVRSYHDLYTRVWFDPADKRASLDPATTWPSIRIYRRSAGSGWLRHGDDYPAEPHETNYSIWVADYDGVGYLAQPTEVELVRLAAGLSVGFSGSHVQLFRDDLDG
jgi:hypothetical protein